MEAIALKAAPRWCTFPINCSPQAMTAVIRGDVQMACLPAASVVPPRPRPASQNSRGLDRQTFAVSAGLPTLKESGIDVEADAWMGLIAPGGTPKPWSTRSTGSGRKHQVARSREKLAAQLMEPVGNAGSSAPGSTRNVALGAGHQGGGCEAELRRVPVIRDWCAKSGQCPPCAGYRRRSSISASKPRVGRNSHTRKYRFRAWHLPSEYRTNQEHRFFMEVIEKNE